MKILTPGLAILLVFMVGSCSAEITGTVVDAETGKPIEGAVILVEWTMTKGVPGMSHTESYKVIEEITDKNGKFTLQELLIPLVHSPDITIYKKGYVAWNNEYTFPDYKKRSDFRLRDDNIYKLEKFKAEYDYNSHHDHLLDDVIHVGLAAEKKLKFTRHLPRGSKQKYDDKVGIVD